MSDVLPPVDPSRAILVEFGDLTVDQQLLIDLHSLRALGKDLPPPVAGSTVVGFWLREGETGDDVFEEIRGWAIVHQMPIRGLIEDDDIDAQTTPG